MSACSVCVNPECQAIESDLQASEKPDWRMLRQKYGVHHLALMRHQRQHMSKPAAYDSTVSRTDEDALHEPLARIDEGTEPSALRSDAIRHLPIARVMYFDNMQVTENPMRQFTRAIDTAAEAYQLAHDDPLMQARMRERLQEKIKVMVQSDDMGIS
jgi:hypothetical protein